MCLISVKKEEDEYDIPTRRRERYTHRERVSISPRHSQIIIANPPPPNVPVIPPPQPAPIFVEPPRPKPKVVLPPRTDTQYIEVSPRSSSEDGRRHHDDYVYERREVRYERDYSPERDDRYEYRYVNAPETLEPPRRHRSVSRHRERSRSRSRHRDYTEDDVKVKITRSRHD